MNSDAIRKYPKIIYDHLNQETDYSCKGSCTCKFIKDRTDYDITVYNSWKNYSKINLPNLSTTVNSNSRGWLS